VGEASRDLRFNQRVLETSLENMDQGISVVDAQLRLVAWNRRYAELFAFPDALLQVGRPIADLARHALQQMPPKGAPRTRACNAAWRTCGGHARTSPSASSPMAASWKSAATRCRAAASSRPSPTSPPSAAPRRRCCSRTKPWNSASPTAPPRSNPRVAKPSVPNDAKGRFLAAIGHDLLQPLHAAHLFTDALGQQVPESGPRECEADSRRAGFDHGPADGAARPVAPGSGAGWIRSRANFALAEVLDPLASEFRVLAAEHGLRSIMRRRTPGSAATRSCCAA
jgi:hypothetical protein